jgi:hypothetical protein
VNCGGQHRVTACNRRAHAKSADCAPGREEEELEAAWQADDQATHAWLVTRCSRMVRHASCLRFCPGARRAATVCKCLLHRRHGLSSENGRHEALVFSSWPRGTRPGEVWSWKNASRGNGVKPRGTARCFCRKVDISHAGTHTGAWLLRLATSGALGTVAEWLTSPSSFAAEDAAPP